MQLKRSEFDCAELTLDKDDLALFLVVLERQLGDYIGSALRTERANLARLAPAGEDAHDETIVDLPTVVRVVRQSSGFRVEISWRLLRTTVHTARNALNVVHDVPRDQRYRFSDRLRAEFIRQSPHLGEGCGGEVVIQRRDGEARALVVLRLDLAAFDLLCAIWSHFLLHLNADGRLMTVSAQADAILRNFVEERTGVTDLMQRIIFLNDRFDTARPRPSVSLPEVEVKAPAPVLDEVASIIRATVDSVHESEYGAVFGHTAEVVRKFASSYFGALLTL